MVAVASAVAAVLLLQLGVVNLSQLLQQSAPSVRHFVKMHREQQQQRHCLGRTRTGLRGLRNCNNNRSGGGEGGGSYNIMGKEEQDDNNNLG